MAIEKALYKKIKLLKRAIRLVDALILNLENVSKNQAMFDIPIKQLTAQVILENERTKSIQKSSPQIDEKIKRLIKLDTEIVDGVRYYFAQIDANNQSQNILIREQIAYYKIFRKNLVNILKAHQHLIKNKRKLGVAGI